MSQTTARMTVYEKRWKLWVSLAEKVNALIKRGYVVLDDGDNKIPKFIITDNEILVCPAPNFSIRWAENNLSYDHGLYTPMREIKKHFNRLVICKPLGVRLDQWEG
jgi:hypothetical protein